MSRSTAFNANKKFKAIKKRKDDEFKEFVMNWMEGCVGLCELSDNYVYYDRHALVMKTANIPREIIDLVIKNAKSSNVTYSETETLIIFFDKELYDQNMKTWNSYPAIRKIINPMPTITAKHPKSARPDGYIELDSTDTK